MINHTSPDTTDEVEELMNKDSEMNVEEIKRKSVNGVLSFFVRTAFLQGIGLASAFILSAFFSPEDFGVYGFVTQIIGLLVFFSDVGLAAALIQKKDTPSLKDYRTAFTLQQILSWVIILLIITIIATGVVQDKVGWVGVWVLMSLGISFPLATLKTIPSIMLERKLEFNKLIIPQIFEQIVFQSVLIYLAWNRYGVLAYAYAIILRSIIGVVVMWFIQPWEIGFDLNRKSLKNLLGFGVKFQLNDFLARIKDQLFFLVLGLFLPLRDFGYLQWSKNWSMYPYNLTVQNVMAITFPTFSRLQNQKALLRKAIEKSIFFISLLIFPLLVGMSVFIWPLTQVIDKYAKWEPAVLSFVLFTLSIGWAAISTPLVNTLNAIGKINLTLKLMLMWTSLTWIITPIFVLKYGFNGVAISAFIISFTSIISIFYVKREIELSVFGSIWRQFLSAVVMAGVGVLGMNYWAMNLKQMFIGMLVVSSSYLITFLIIGWNKLFIELKSLRVRKNIAV